MAGLCETWLLPHLTLTLPGYIIIREDRLRGWGGGVLPVREELEHTEFKLPRWPGGCLEVAAARIVLRKGWLTVAVCYNPGGAGTYLELELYISLPPLVLVMGDFNAHHLCWNPSLLPHHRHTPGNILF